MKTNIIYRISRGYRKVTVWEGSRSTGARLCLHTSTPVAGLSRKERHAAIAAYLFGTFRIPGPVYRPTEAERIKDGSR